MLSAHQRVRKWLFFEMYTGSISPGPRKSYFNYFNITNFKSHVTLLICKHQPSTWINHDRDINIVDDGNNTTPPIPPRVQQRQWPQDDRLGARDARIIVGKGSNDARRVVWALGECFLFHFVLFWILINVYVFKGCSLHTTRRGERRKAVAKRKGPNDASGVVWAISKFFFFSFRFYTTN